MVPFILFIMALLAYASAKPHPDHHLRVHESIETPPPGFAFKRAADSDTALHLRIALVQGNAQGLIDALYSVSTPGLPHYGQHLSKDQVENFVSPTSESVAAVKSWLDENEVTPTTISPAGDWFKVSMPVSKANEIFNTTFTVYTHTDTGRETIRVLYYSIPTELENHLDFVHPTISFPNPKPIVPVISAPLSTVVANDSSATCSSNAITPACVQSLYGIPTSLAKNSANQLAVSGFIDEYAQKSDLTKFLKEFRPDLASSTTFTVQTLDGGGNPQNPSEAGLEANLDIQYTVGLASGVPTIFISVGDNWHDGNLEGFMDIIDYLLREDNPPQVLTTSYGSNEDQTTQPLSNNLCNAYAQLGARGVSIMFASGDGGVAGTRDNSCTTFVPTFPSGCPFMTSVGATALSGSTETAANFSAGGFSNYYVVPDYQASAVRGYLTSLGSTYSGKYNASGRGYPDVSAIGQILSIVNKGNIEGVEGTSCSSPIFASIISLINDELISAGKPPLGFLNPFLYANPNAFLDITSGSNPGCETKGFPAAKGWDPVTGLGTPNFQALRAAAGL